jgi:hypothetical protein
MAGLFDNIKFTRTRLISEPLIALYPTPPAAPTEPLVPAREPESLVEIAPEPVSEATEGVVEEASEKRDLFGNSSTDFLEDMDKEISELNLDDINVDDIDLDDESMFD